MAVIEGGVSSSLAGVGSENANPLHTVNKPQSYGSLGHYQYAGTTGAMAAALAANSEILQFRWTDATRLCVINKVSLTGMYATTAFAAGAVQFRLSIARSFTAAGTGGGTVTLTGDNNNLRTSMGTSLVGEIRVATTAALGAGTKTLDANDIGQVNSHSSGGTGSATPIIGSIYLPQLDLFECDVADGEHPIILAQNEGIIIRATVPGTGVWTAGFTVKWSELAAF